MNNSIENQITRLEQELKTLKELVNKPKEKWQPTYYNQHKFLVDIAACPPEEQNNRGLIYYNAADATKASKQLEQYARMMKFAYERNGNWQPDWNNKDKPKTHIFYTHYNNQWATASVLKIEFPTSIYFKNVEDAQELADLLNNGLF